MKTVTIHCDRWGHLEPCLPCLESAVYSHDEQLSIRASTDCMSKDVWGLDGTLSMSQSVLPLDFTVLTGQREISSFLVELAPENEIMFPLFLFLTGTQGLEYNFLFSVF